MQLAVPRKQLDKHRRPLRRCSPHPLMIWILLMSAALHLVIDVFHQPKGNSLHCIALLLQLPQKVYVCCAGRMQRPAYREPPLFQLFLHDTDFQEGLQSVT